MKNIQKRLVPLIIMALPVYIQAAFTLDTVDNKTEIVNTNNPKPTLAGSCNANDTITAYANAVAITPTALCANNQYSISPANAFEDGRYSFAAKSSANQESNSITTIITTTIPDAPTVTISEDSNNDGQINKDTELNGNINVNVLFPESTYLSDILRITDFEGNTKEMDITLDMLDNGYNLEYPVPASNQSFTVRAVIVDISGNISTTSEDTAIINEAQVIPDYVATITAQGTIISGDSGDFNIVIRIAEFASGKNFAGDVRFTIVKNSNLTLLFNNTETSRQGQTMQNNLWKFEEKAGIYLFTYTGNNGEYPPHTVSKVGLSGTFNSPNSAKGQFPLDVTIPSGSGETELQNNKDSEVIEYNNIQ